MQNVYENKQQQESVVKIYEFFISLRLVLGSNQASKEKKEMFTSCFKIQQRNATIFLSITHKLSVYFDISSESFEKVVVGSVAHSMALKCFINLIKLIIYFTEQSAKDLQPYLKTTYNFNIS